MARIYLADLSSYNAGDLNGEWFDLSELDHDGLMEGLRKMLRESLHPNTMVKCPECGDSEYHPLCCPECSGAGKVDSAEEWAIHDYEGFFDIKVNEYDDLEYLCELSDAIDGHGEAYAIWHDHMGQDEVDIEKFRDAYQGEFEDLNEWAEQWHDDCGTFHGASDTLKNYFDYEGWARDAEMGGDIWSEEGNDGRVHVFNNH